MAEQALPVANAPKIVIRTVKSLRVGCPYCVFGYADVIEVTGGGQVQIEGILDPRKCVKCKKYFRLKPRVQLVGVPLEEENHG